MRKMLLAVAAVALTACAKSETPADTTAMAPPPPPPPAALTAAQVAGTWHGQSRMEGDTATVKWTLTSTSDSTGNFMVDGTKDAVPYTSAYSGDSLVASSSPFPDPRNAKGPKIVFRSVGRMSDGKLMGTFTDALASKPDSVVARGTWEATKAP